jgi:UMF1 family MFS transporter
MGIHKYKAAIRYALYDAGNSNYATLIPSIAFPIYFKTVVASRLAAIDAIWGAMIMVSTLFAAVLAPKLGEIADRRGSRQAMLRWISWLAIMGTAGFYFLSKDQVILGIILFIGTNTAFLLAVFLYDATLATVSSTGNAAMVSSFAWAVGYIGGLIGLFLALSTEGSDAERLHRIFLIVAVLFLILSLPLVCTKRQSSSHITDIKSTQDHQGILTLLRTFMKDKTRSRLFWSYFFYSNGISAVIYFTSIYATTTLGYSLEQLLWLFVAMSIIAIPAVVVFGKLSDLLGQIRTLQLVVACWVVIVIIVAFTDAATFKIVACIAAGFLGPAQALSRSLFRVIFPMESMSSFFGIQALAARSSALIGPVLFGVVSSLTGSQRIGILATTSLLATGLILLFLVSTMEVNTHGK